ncbi:MAG: 2-hydroxy-3-oxopropionate reductase [Candidatus Celerinatantimonas neptuna]|nr:MAG: 2-hydroxy-3-oxopropionate reductase [Candidatus Celerinatantimonas neptuna]
MKVGFIGLGYLGKAISQRLIECSYQLGVYNRNLDKATDLDATIYNSPDQLTKDCDVICLCLFDSQAVEEVLCSDKGILAALKPEQIVLDMTTNHYKKVVEFEKMISAKQAIYLESPIFGSVVPARKGALTIVTSGQKSAYESIIPLLEKISAYRFYLPQIGQASRMKLLNNLALGSFMAVLAEITHFGETVGIDKQVLLDILSVGGGNSGVLNAKKSKLLDDDFTPHFKSSLIYKDLHCLQDLAYETQEPLLMAAITKEMFAKTCQAGFADYDFSAVYAMLKGEKDSD